MFSWYCLVSEGWLYRGWNRKKQERIGYIVSGDEDKRLNFNRKRDEGQWAHFYKVSASDFALIKVGFFVFAVMVTRVKALTNSVWGESLIVSYNLFCWASCQTLNVIHSTEPNDCVCVYETVRQMDSFINTLTMKRWKNIIATKFCFESPKTVWVLRSLLYFVANQRISPFHTSVWDIMWQTHSLCLPNVVSRLSNLFLNEMFQKSKKSTDTDRWRQNQSVHSPALPWVPVPPVSCEPLLPFSSEETQTQVVH